LPLPAGDEGERRGRVRFTFGRGAGEKIESGGGNEGHVGVVEEEARGAARQGAYANYGGSRHASAPFRVVDEKYAAQALERGLNAFFPKPCHDDEGRAT
jgi:hypothetical protein